MILCLKCGRLNLGAAHFCGSGCGSFRGGRCPEGHVTHGPRCGTCGLATSEAETPSVNLGCLGHIAAWGLVLVGMRFAVRDGNFVRLADTAFTFVVGRSIGSILESAFTVLAMIGILALVLQCCIGDKVNVLGGYGRFLAFLFTGLWQVAVGGGKLLFALVEGVAGGEKRGVPR